MKQITKLSDNQYIVSQKLPLKEILKWKISNSIKKKLMNDFYKIETECHNEECGYR